MNKKRHFWAQQALREGRFSDAEQTYYQIIEEDPKDADGHFHLAALQLRRSANTEALQSIGQAIKCDPNDARHHVAHGQILNEQKNTEAAEAAFEKPTIRIVKYIFHRQEVLPCLLSDPPVR